MSHPMLPDFDLFIGIISNMIYKFYITHIKHMVSYHFHDEYRLIILGEELKAL